jgi:SAM-dependent methyltransferase
MAILYKHSWLFHSAMTCAYRTHRQERFRALAQWVPEGAHVLDVCCGDGSFSKHLAPSVRYRGLDHSPAFVRTARRHGRQVEIFDLRHDRLPPSQIVVCQISLYQFYPEEAAVLARLFEAAKQRLIISESVRSLAKSRWPWIASLGAWGLHVEGMTNSRFRFTPEGLEELFQPYRPYIGQAGVICGGRDWLFVLDK